MAAFFLSEHVFRCMEKVDKARILLSRNSEGGDYTKEYFKGNTRKSNCICTQLDFLPPLHLQHLCK